ncbi:MAG: aspartate carbamoyltransferase catalytic subunit [Deltaproteobacteria bacterium]|nr:aspartate carbamoyltransferase catalytic subunit [Deltaproteobacteria bacterium]
MSSTARPFAHRHLLGIEALSAEDLVQLLDLGEAFLEIGERPIKKVPTLRGRTVINLFLEASTRTRTSFEIAAKRLSADAVNVSGSGSSTSKGESLLDTVRNLAAMRPDVVVLRHHASGAAAFVARHIDAAVVNAGDGTHEHPTQALLDASTIRHHKGRIAGLRVAIVGDIEHSRVARSNLLALTRLGADVALCAPLTMLPHGIEAMAGEHRDRVSTHHRLEAALEGADVVMMLRIQRERMGDGPARFPSNREYSRQFGLSPRTLAHAKPDAIVMHPGPINRGVELDPVVADGSRSVVLEQVTRGVALRMAVLYLLGAGAALQGADAGPGGE